MTATWPPTDGSPYIPSNTLEGMTFIDEWCCRCASMGPEDETGCRFLAASFMGALGGADSGWLWQDGMPTCPHFITLPPGPDDPPAPDPRQQALALEEEA